MFVQVLIHVPVNGGQPLILGLAPVSRGRRRRRIHGLRMLSAIKLIRG